MTKNNWKNLFALILFVVGIFFSASQVFAESCPSKTTVEGTTVTFVGEVTDMGGDSSVSAWFEYGKSKSYGYQTYKKTLSGPGIYCIEVTNLDPCTTYHYRAVAENSAGKSFGEDKTFTTTCEDEVRVDLEVNGRDGSITIPYKERVTLTWDSENADHCWASGDWSGTKGLSGSYTTSKLTTDKKYTITCSGESGTDSDTVRVYIEEEDDEEEVDLYIKKMVRNVSDGQTIFSSSTEANPEEILEFKIKITNQGEETIDDLLVEDNLPSRIIYQGNLKIDGRSVSGNIVEGKDIGDLEPDETKTIIFQARVASGDQFSFGSTELLNTVTVSAEDSTFSDTAKVLVRKKAVAGAATTISTGLFQNKLLDFVLLPLSIAIILFLLLKKYFLVFIEKGEELWEKTLEKRAKRVLEKKINKIKLKEA